MRDSDTAFTSKAGEFLISELRREVGCSGNLNWRCQVACELNPEVLEEPIQEAGWSSKCHHPSLRVFRHSSGHEVAWVLATGRIQIRVSIATAKNQRKREAAKIYRTLCQFLTNHRARALAPTPLVARRNSALNSPTRVSFS